MFCSVLCRGQLTVEFWLAVLGLFCFLIVVLSFFYMCCVWLCFVWLGSVVVFVEYMLFFNLLFYLWAAPSSWFRFSFVGFYGVL